MSLPSQTPATTRASAVSTPLFGRIHFYDVNCDLRLHPLTDACAEAVNRASFKGAALADNFMQRIAGGTIERNGGSDSTLARLIKPDGTTIEYNELIMNIKEMFDLIPLLVPITYSQLGAFFHSTTSHRAKSQLKNSTPSLEVSYLSAAAHPLCFFSLLFCFVLFLFSLFLPSSCFTDRSGTQFLIDTSNGSVVRQQGPSYESFHVVSPSFTHFFSRYISDLQRGNYGSTVSEGISRFPLLDTVCGSDCTTRSIRIRASVLYVPEQSKIDVPLRQRQYFFTYHIRVTHDGASHLRATLVSRKWTIEDENGKIETVAGQMQ